MSQIDTKAGKKANKNELRDTIVALVSSPHFRQVTLP